MPVANETRLFLCGDVMTGRGVDQILPHPGAPDIHEGYMRSALGYVTLAEDANGPLPRQVGWEYIWGEARSAWQRLDPAVRIINLETAVTRSNDWIAKGINYRMHPDNSPCLSAAAIDCAVLANNHVLDWGVSGLKETLSVLQPLLAVCGAGESLAAAREPAILPGYGCRIMVFAAATESSGVPAGWAAEEQQAGVYLIPESVSVVDELATYIAARRGEGDIVVFSLHWGGNWGFAIEDKQRQLARALIERAGVDIVHGHSSHHPRGIEVHQGKLILYGCGDFLNDYEGIHGHEQYRGDLTFMYFPVLDAARRLLRLTLVPLQIYRFSLRRPTREDIHWLHGTLDRECRALGSGLCLTEDGDMQLAWQAQ